MNSIFANPNLKSILQQVLEETKLDFDSQKKSSQVMDVGEESKFEDKADLNTAEIENENRKKTDRLELTRQLTTLKGEAKFEHFNLKPGQVWAKKGSPDNHLTVEGIWHDLSTMTYLVKFKELNQIFDTHRSNLVSKLSGFDYVSGPDPEKDGTVIDNALNRTTGSLAFKRSLNLTQGDDLQNNTLKDSILPKEVEVITSKGKLKLYPGKVFTDGKKSLTVVGVSKIDPLNTSIAFKEIADGKPEIYSDIMWIDMLKKLFGDKILE